MLVAVVIQVPGSRPTIGDHVAPPLDGLVHESLQRLGARVAHHIHPSTAGRLVRLLAWLVHLDPFHGAENPGSPNAELPTPARALPTDLALVHLDGFAAQRVLVALTEDAADLVEQAPCGLVAANARLTLELQCRDAGPTRRHPPQGIQLDRQRQLRAV